MKITEKQKVLLARILEIILFVFGISLGLVVLGLGFSMMWTLLKSLLA